MVTTGYLNAPGETARSFDGTWFRTGDLGLVDEHGLVYLVDRQKDVVISAGENISCTEVESAIAASDLFSEVAAFGVPDPRLGERLVVAVTPRTGQTALTADSVRDIARQSMPEFKIPREVIMDMSPIPRNATGKMLKRELRRMYDERNRQGPQ
ncbi:class I adenylate-forming enzyme family protein [Gordonia rhizosphera]|uniref:Putative fatty-acid--CoA ligase n=1 Tax=Gordonia rhizosphera NBRC 16068 TaxID=1108045 RepID=K6V8X5_9ACTN|nr:putative fatty-acid--CoA ligase [Gordonia rhizosphera NBRC 16068]